MNENTQKGRREWVKNAAIIFLTIMLILTFFSNTIMNYSLPEVATQYVQPGSITAKVRGTGNVEATDPYNVMVKESRVISSVAVQQGDVVEKDQVIYYLEDSESDELKKAEDELEDLELAYMKGLFGSNVSPEVIANVSSGNTGSFSAYQAKVVEMQNKLDAAQDRVTECQNTVDAITLQGTIEGNDASISTIPDELAQDQAQTDLANAEARFTERKNAKIADINAEIAEVEKQIADLETLVADGEGTVGDNTVGGDTAVDTTDALQGTVSAAQADLQTKEAALNNALADLNSKVGTFGNADSAYSWSKNADWAALTNEQQLSLQAFISAYQDYQAAYTDYQTSYGALENVTGLSDHQASLAAKRNELASLQAKLAEVSAITVSSSESAQDAQERLENATRNIVEINSANKMSAVAYQNKLANANAALKNAQAVYDLAKEEQAQLAANISAELDLAKANKDIAEKKEEIAKLKEKSMGSAITAPVAGTVTNLSYVAGETTKPEEAAAVIQVAGKGFTVSFSVTNEQAKKVKVGDMAELQNAWYYDDMQVMLAAVKPDPESAGQKKMLVFEVTGENVVAGQALNLSVGQRSAEYEYVVPNSAVREDSNGKFILIIESKSSPLGNRYMASRVDVEVLASDDNNTAISGNGLYGYEYVITTSTKPVEAGKQVRLNEN